MSKQLTQDEANALISKTSKTRNKYTLIMFRSDVVAGWHGFKKALRFAAELTVGASASITMWAAYMYVKNSTYPRPVVYAMTFGVALMAVTALAVLGRYLIQKGRK